MTALDDFKRFVDDEQAAAYYAKWTSQNPGAAAKWYAFRDAILNGDRPPVPDMGTNSYGRGLVDGGVEYLNATTPAPSPTPTPTPNPSSLEHVDTYAYVDMDLSGGTTAPSFVAQWLTYAETTNDDGKAIAALPHAANRYMDCSRIYYDQTGASLPIIGHDSESWWLHKPGTSADKANRIVLTWNGTTHAYVLNLANPDVIAWLANYAATTYKDYAGFMLDDAPPYLDRALSGSGTDYTSSLEIASDSAWQAAYRALASALAGRLLVFNCYDANPWLRNSIESFGLLEGGPWTSGAMLAATRFANMLDLCSVAPRIVLRSDGTARGSTQARLVHAASVLLAWEPGKVVSWTDYARENYLQVYPEACIVPSNPAKTMAPSNNPFDGKGGLGTTGGHIDIQVSTNVYRRDFSAWSFKGQPQAGGLTVMVNVSSTAVSVPAGFTKQVTPTGMSIEAGGGIGIVAAPATVAPQSAVLLIA